MFTLEYDPDNGIPIGDGACRDFVLELVNTDSLIIVSTSNVIQMARYLSLVEKFDVTFKFRGEVVEVNRFGAIMDWPEGFCDLEGKLATGIVRYAIDLRRAEREKKEKEDVSSC